MTGTLSNAAGPLRSGAIVFGLGVWAAAVALAPGVPVKLALAAPLLVAPVLGWLAEQPSRWISLFFFILLLTPPLPLPFGDSGVHLAPFLALFGIIAGLIGIDRWRSPLHPLTFAFLMFLAVLAESCGLGALYSGWQIGAASLTRVALFALSVYVFLYAYAGPRGVDGARDERTAKLLFWLGSTAAVFACIDFYWQLPAPAGYSDQFVWLDEGVLRRAQGLFYEASTLGNVCAFFLVMIAVALFRRREQAWFSKKCLLVGGLALAAALMFSYSRASVFNVVTAIAVLAFLRLQRFRRSIVWIAAAALAAILGVEWFLPSFSSNYWGRLLGSFSFFWQSPDAVLSGRLGHWSALLTFLAREPWHAILGVGYKTLPYSNFTGAPVVADNTYLGLLVETGIVGLGVFILLNVAILRTGWKALRSNNPKAAFLGEWIFCFWCGQMVQMSSGDLITYWRALPLYFWVLGAAARQTEEPN